MEEFHEILREIFTKTILKTKEFAYHNLKGVINNKNLVVLKGDEDSSVVIMDQPDYVSKFLRMIEEGINNDVYTPANDTTLEDLKL